MKDFRTTQHCQCDTLFMQSQCPLLATWTPPLWKLLKPQVVLFVLFYFVTGWPCRCDVTGVLGVEVYVGGGGGLSVTSLSWLAFTVGVHCPCASPSCVHLTRTVEHSYSQNTADRPTVNISYSCLFLFFERWQCMLTDKLISSKQLSESC